MISRATQVAFLVSGLAFGQARLDTLPVMPRPSSIAFQPGALPVDSSFSISISGAGASDARIAPAIDAFFAALSRQTGVPLLPKVVRENASLRIVIEQRDHAGPQRLGDDEQYSLEISQGSARLSADKPLGVIRGLETLLQLTSQNTGPAAAPGFSIPNLTLHDEPRFAWRGLSLDVSRHFIPVEGVERTLDGMAAVKLNVLHWHLSDDQGFRVESRRFPRLQQYGSDGLYYTQAEIRQILAYARDRGIRIVPEFDMPGHATSWLVGYPKLGARSGEFHVVRGNGVMSDLIDPTQESTYRLLDGFIGEMTKLFPDDYFHIGGDEVNPKEWMQNPRIQRFMQKHRLADGKQLQVYFNQRVLKMVTKHGKHMVGWDEVLQPNLPKSVIIQSWRGQSSLWQAAKEGYEGILSAGYYLDLMYPAAYHYAVDPMKTPPPAPDHDPKEGAEPAGIESTLSPDERRRILGGEAAMWEEIATAENLDAKLWPRLAAIAERFWSPEVTTDTASMYQRLELVNGWLAWRGLKQRTNLELMRARLVNGESASSLDLLASVLEPVKGYARHENESYSLLTPFNRLVDSIPPESETARRFREEVRTFLGGPKGSGNSASLRKQLTAWWENAEAIRPLLENNSLLREDLPVAESVGMLCKTGLDALSSLESGVAPAAGWKASALAAAKKASERKADLLVQIGPAIEDLIGAVPDGAAK